MNNTHDAVFLQDRRGREHVLSFAPFLRRSLEMGHLMDAARMEEGARKICRWIGFGIGKGVTHPALNISVFAIPSELSCGLHGELVQGHDRVSVDATPRCYDTDAELGFSGFIRWVYFADPLSACDVFGIDWSMRMPANGGVARSMLDAMDVILVAARHGIPAEAEVALLNAKMVEPEWLTAWKREHGLATVGDWIANAATKLALENGLCPRCGGKTLEDRNARHCFQCGCRPDLVRASRNIRD